MSLFSELTNIYDCDLENIHGDEVYNFINRNKEKIEELDKNITTEFASKNKKINILTTENYKKAYQISKLKTEIIQKDQRIAELEDELENFKLETDNYESKYTKVLETKQKIETRLVKCGKKLRQQQEENAKLQEQLENAIVPKFKVGQEVWYYHIGRYKTYSGIIDDIKWFAKNGWIYYRLPNLQRADFWIREDELFTTEAEAQKYLEERK